MRAHQVVVASFIGLTLAGCAAGLEPTGGQDGQQAESPPAAGATHETIVDDPGGSTFTEIAVRVGADGSRTVTRRAITLDEELRENAAREALAGGGMALESVSQDSACAGSSFWLYDQPSNVGNKICFSGTGNLDLTQYLYKCTWSGGLPWCTTWASAKQSYWAGVAGGWFQSRASYACTNPIGVCAPFAVYGRGLALSACEASDDGIDLGGGCTMPWIDGPPGYYPTGYAFKPNGAVKVEVDSAAGVQILGAQLVADAKGTVVWGPLPQEGVVSGSCGEVVKFTDLSTGLAATEATTICWKY